MRFSKIFDNLCKKVWEFGHWGGIQKNCYNFFNACFTSDNQTFAFCLRLDVSWVQ